MTIGKYLATMRKSTNEGVMQVAERMMNIQEILNQFTSLIAYFEQTPDTLIIVQDEEGAPKLAVLPFKVYQDMKTSIDSLNQTLDVLQDQEFMQEFQRIVENLERKDPEPPLN